MVVGHRDVVCGDPLRNSRHRTWRPDRSGDGNRNAGLSKAKFDGSHALTLPSNRRCGSSTKIRRTGYLTGGSDRIAIDEIYDSLW